MSLILRETWDKLIKKMQSLDIKEEDLVEKFILGSGKGGQKINKTSSCVYLKHIITGIEIKCQDSRSRDVNRYYARKRLCEMIEERALGEKSRRRQEIEKKRRQKRRRSKRAQQKVLDAKRRRGEIKQQRSSPSSED